MDKALTILGQYVNLAFWCLFADRPLSILVFPILNVGSEKYFQIAINRMVVHIIWCINYQQ